MNPVPEIRRENVFISPEMTTQEIMQKYGLSSQKSSRVKRQGFFVKNYSRKQIIIDSENFSPEASYNTAWKVYWKNFSWIPLATIIKDDLVQEAVTRMFELSGKVKEGANEKYTVGYCFIWVAHNAMLSYLKSWQRHIRSRVLGDIGENEVNERIYKVKKREMVFQWPDIVTGDHPGWPYGHER
jgi:hypothetical protein